MEFYHRFLTLRQNEFKLSLPKGWLFCLLYFSEFLVRFQLTAPPFFFFF